MLVNEIIRQLKKYPQDAEICIEMDINGVEFDCPIKEIYESGKCYIYGKDKFEVDLIFNAQ